MGRHCGREPHAAYATLYVSMVGAWFWGKGGLADGPLQSRHRMDPCAGKAFPNMASRSDVSTKAVKNGGGVGLQGLNFEPKLL